MSRFGELHPGYDREIADKSRFVVDEAAVAAANAAYATQKAELAALVESRKAEAMSAAQLMRDAVIAINLVLRQLRDEGLDISPVYKLEIRNLRSKGGDYIYAGFFDEAGKKLAENAVDIYRDSVDTDEMGDKVAAIFGLLEE